MKLRFQFLAGAIAACFVTLSTWAQTDPSPESLGAEKKVSHFAHIQIKNLQDESLGRIKDLGIDLVNGRIVEVLVVSDEFLGMGGKVVAVPPHALIPDLLNDVYRLDVSVEHFKAAPEIDLSKWTDAGRSDRVAAAYRHFGEEPYFLEEGETASRAAARPKVPLGYVERCTKLIDLPVGNFQNEHFGKVWSMTLDITGGRILTVIIMAPGNFRTKSIVPAMALSFSPQRDALLLDSTKMEFADEPRYIFTEAAFGQKQYSEEQSYEGPRTGTLEQGKSYLDVDRTVRINREMKAAKIRAHNVQVGTLNGRVTLRGWVLTKADKRRIAQIAVAASRLELVDNQISVGKPKNIANR